MTVVYLAHISTQISRKHRPFSEWLQSCIWPEHCSWKRFTKYTYFKLAYQHKQPKHVGRRALYMCCTHIEFNIKVEYLRFIIPLSFFQLTFLNHVNVQPLCSGWHNIKPGLSIFHNQNAWDFFLSMKTQATDAGPGVVRKGQNALVSHSMHENVEPCNV